jgi:hypothetical protein
MRVLTYNIHGWQTIASRPNYALIAELLNLADADVRV